MEAAQDCALAVSRARAAGKAVSVADGQIAAIAMSCRYAVATRDAASFQAAGVQVVNPCLPAG